LVIYYKAAQQHQLFTSGVFRVDDPEGKIFSYINNCDGTYTRMSTHFNERISETLALHGGQCGLDFKNITTLPAKKGSVLFFRLGDGTLILKLEHSGCPPIWQTQFMTIENTIEYTKHSRDYMRTRIAHNPGMPVRRTEKVPDDAIKIFNEALQILYPPQNFKVQGEFLTDTYRQHLQSYGITHGISAMVSILSGDLSPADSALEKESTGLGSFIIFNDPTQPSTFPSNTQLTGSFITSCIMIDQGKIDYQNVSAQRSQLYELISQDRSRGYKGERKGSEVCIAIDWSQNELDENFSIV